MVARTPNPPRQGTITDLITGLLDRGYNQTAQPVLEAIGRSLNSGIIAQRLDELEQEAQRLAAAGERLKPDNPVLRALTADMETVLRANAQLIDGAAPTLQQSASDAAGTIQRQLALPGMTDQYLKSIGIVWNRPDPEAVARLVNYTNNPQWAAFLQRFPADVLGIVNNQAIRGIALGWSPLKTAREITRQTQNFPAYYARARMRTLQLTSYRDSTALHQTANRAIIQDVIRIAARDTRTCLTCIAESGTVIWSSETDGFSPVPRVLDHEAGRCTSICRIKGRPRNIQTGPEWFDNLPPERQRQQASFVKSPGKWDAFSRGRVTLTDFRQQYRDPVFGDMLRESSLSGAIRRARAPQRQAGKVVTVNGLMPADTGSPGDTIQSLEAFLQSSDGPLADALLDIDMNLTGFDAQGNFAILPENTRNAAKLFVAESRYIEYSKEYIVSLVVDQATQNGVDTTQIDGEKLYNDYFANRARAIQLASQIGNVRLTEAQRRRLQEAIDGGYLDMQYTTESSERGSLANRAQRNRGKTGGLSGAELRQARENFRDWVLGLDG